MKLVYFFFSEERLKQLRNTNIEKRKIMSVDGQVITRYSLNIDKKDKERVVGYAKLHSFFNKLKINGENLKDTDTSGNSIIH